MGSGKNRNKPCWCGSGKKYKRCHSDRENQKPVNRFQALETFKKAKKKICAAPKEHPISCEGQIIKAHTVSKSSSLKKIAKDSHVYKTLPDVLDIHRANGRPSPKLEGINDASTFTGFCQKHDRELFSPIENQEFNWTDERVFLVAYRAFCYEWHAKNSVSGLEDFFKSLDAGRHPIEQIYMQGWFRDFFIGTNAAVKDQKTYKNDFDRMLLSQDYSKIIWVGFEFDKPPSVMGAGGFCPLQDFAGNRLQDLTDLSVISQPIYYSSFSSGNRGIFCLAWIDGYGDACNKFVNSFLEIEDENKPDEIIALLFDHSENLFLAPDWWEGLTEEQQENLKGRSIKNGSLIEEGIPSETLSTTDCKIIKNFQSLRFPANV